MLAKLLSLILLVDGVVAAVRVSRLDVANCESESEGVSSRPFSEEDFKLSVDAATNVLKFAHLHSPKKGYKSEVVYFPDIGTSRHIPPRAHDLLDLLPHSCTMKLLTSVQVKAVELGKVFKPTAYKDCVVRQTFTIIRKTLGTWNGEPLQVKQESRQFATRRCNLAHIFPSWSRDPKKLPCSVGHLKSHLRDCAALFMPREKVATQLRRKHSQISEKRKKSKKSKRRKMEEGMSVLSNTTELNTDGDAHLHRPPMPSK